MKDIAEVLGCAESTVSRIESGGSSVSEATLQTLMGFYEVDEKERKRFEDMRGLAVQGRLVKRASGVPDSVNDLAELEAHATAIFGCGSLLVPGLLQTREYMRAIMDDAGVDPANARRMQAARLARQKRVIGQKPYTAYLLESALRQPIGTPEVHAGQLGNLAALSRQELVSLRVIRQGERGWHPGLVVPFALLEIPLSPSVAHVEHLDSVAYLTDAESERTYRDAIAKLDRKAVDEETSRDLFVAFSKELAVQL